MLHAIRAHKKNLIKIADKEVKEWKYAACGYCSTGGSIECKYWLDEDISLDGLLDIVHKPSTNRKSA